MSQEHSSIREKTGECCLCVFTCCSQKLSVFPSLVLVPPPEHTEMDQHCSRALDVPSPPSSGTGGFHAQKLNKLPSRTKRGSCSRFLTSSDKHSTPSPALCCLLQGFTSFAGPGISDKDWQRPGQEGSFWLMHMWWEKPAAITLCGF